LIIRYQTVPYVMYSVLVAWTGRIVSSVIRGTAAVAGWSYLPRNLLLQFYEKYLVVKAVKLGLLVKPAAPQCCHMLLFKSKIQNH